MAKASTTLTQTFVYTGTDSSGESIKGELTGQNMQFAKALLRKQGITPIKIRRKPKPLLVIEKKINALDITLFVRQLAALIKAGIPLVQSFIIIAESLDKPAMKQLVLQIKADVESGTPFAAVLSKHPKRFDALFCALIDAGEQSGTLETMLERMATYKEKSQLLKAKIKKALTYPAAVIVVAMVVSLILLIKVVPVFETLFASFDAQLPAFTQAVVSLSNGVRQWWIVLLTLMLCAATALYQTHKRQQKFAHYLDKVILKLPIFGKLTYQAIIARFARTLATTFAAGVPLIDALHSTASATNNHVYYQATQQLKAEVTKGHQLHAAMRSSQLFPALAVQMVSIGEESGSLDEMLDKVAQHYEAQVEQSIDGLTSLLEPVIMVILGVLVGGLVIAMYLPIFQMGSVIS
ncbi:type II secretion system F family protein [Psychrobacter sp. FDAARGOS_221]|uniref:type II secretion system F family protein n=1 Tax=Psychrobacter sp. FDAARGOS_221 TaxID=1975705 RepID=UPI000BB54E3D|nr:type II secretion system F family protein [Psychrobacter sp. FDAARGOS_221]PNK60590.1 type II secretion system F family protein [Psychrobacter sp. FDAARGOS_221]